VLGLRDEDRLLRDQRRGWRAQPHLGLPPAHQILFVGGLLARQLAPQNFRNVLLQSREIKLSRNVMKPTNTYERELVCLGDMLRQET
jgi:hypothetical protein